MVKYVRGRNTRINDVEGGLNLESDCEDGSTEVGLETPDAKEEKEEARAVLITGSFSARVHFLTPMLTLR